jgi:hypothetical protein
VASAPAVYECKACHVRREVTVVDDGASKLLPENAEARATYVKNVLRHATCPACKARDPVAVADHKHERSRDLFVQAACYLGLAAAAYFVPMLALIPLVFNLLMLVLVAKMALRRGNGRGLVRNVVITIAMIAWVIVVPRWAFVVPGVIAALSFLPGNSSSDPFLDAAEQLRFAESPYRG